MNRISMIGIALCAVSLGICPTPVHAYCVRDADIAQFWALTFPDLVIPVWVGYGGDNTTAWSGLSPEDVARVTIEVIARHNETVVAPKLYFAGFSDKGFDWQAQKAIDDLPSGISILSIACDHPEELCKDTKAVACANVGSRSNTTDSIGWALLLPPGCSMVSEWSLTEHVDLAQVMLHEIGHILGLKHSNLTKDECETEGGVHVGDPAGASTVMHEIVPANFAAYRSWRRDDIEALAHLYGAVSPAQEIAWWNDDAYPEYPKDSASTSLVGMSVSRSVAVSNHGLSTNQVIATTGPDGRVLHRIMDVDGGVTPTVVDAVVDPGPEGLTWTLPAAAIGMVGSEERVFVAWMANEGYQSTLLTVRLATRRVDDLSWTYANHAEQLRVNRLSMGFDDVMDMLYVATIHPWTSEVLIAMFDGEGQPFGSVASLQDFVAFDVGTPSCADSRCLIPFSQPVFGGPNLGIAEVAIDLDAQILSLMSVSVHAPLDTFGRLTLIEDAVGLWASSGERRFELGGYPSLMPDVAAFSANPNGRWPIGVGRWNDGGNARIFQPREVVCGNGIVQASEECDDANMVAGDGCDMCSNEVDGNDVGDDEAVDSNDVGDDEVGNVTDESGSPVDDQGGGCECRVTPSPNRAGMLALAGVGMVVRRRRTTALQS